MNPPLVFCAQYLIGIPVLLFIWALVICSSRDRKALVLRGLATLLMGVLLAKGGGRLFYDTRPFVALHAQPVIPHVPDNGFPSDHALVAFSLAFLILPFHRWLGLAATAASAGIAVGRVGCLFHSPMDMMGSLVMAATAATVALFIRRNSPRLKTRQELPEEH